MHGSCYYTNEVYSHVRVSMWGAVRGRMPDSQSSEPSSNPPLLPFRKLGIFVLSVDALVDSAA